ncbi:unnamed protein product [Closterium sp. NIES-54]
MFGPSAPPLGPLATAPAIAATATAATATAATIAPEYCATMASLRVLAFDHEGRPVASDTWHDDLQLYLLSDIKDCVSLFDHVSGVAPAPPTTADASTRSQWLSRDATACLAICNHLPVAECTHFGQHTTAKALYDAVVARYSSPAIAALGRLLLPYLFPKLSAFATVADLVTHLRTSDARNRATAPTEFLATNQPPMFITLYFIVSRLPDSLRSVRDHFLSLDPTSLTVDLLEQHLLAAETSAVAIGAALDTPCSPFFEGAKRRSSKGKGGQGGGGGSGGGGGGSGSGGGGSGGGGGGSGGGGGCGTGGGSGGSGGGGGGGGMSGSSGGGGTSGGRSGPRRGGPGGGQRQQQQRRSENQSPQQLCQTCGKFHTEHRCFSRLVDAWHAEFGDDVERPRWTDLLRSEVAIFDLDYDAIISAMYALSFSADSDCYRCVPPDPGIEAAALGASASGTPPGTAPAKALHTFTLDSGTSRSFFRDSTTLTPLPAPVPNRLADPSGSPVVARSSTVLPCLAVPSGSLSGLHLPSFSTNLVSTAALHDAMVTTTTPGGQRVSIYTCIRTVRHLSTFTRRPGSSLYTLATEPSQVAAGGEFSSDLLRDFYRREDILQTFTISDSPQQNGIAECSIGLVIEVAPTSMIHAAAPHFLWPFAVRYAAHQLNLWPRVSLLETSPTLRWTGKVGDASVFRPGSAGSKAAGSGGAEPEGVEPQSAESKDAESGGAAPKGAVLCGGPAGALARLSLHQLREWLVRLAHHRGGASAAGGDGNNGAGSAGGTGGTVATGPGGAGAAGTGGVGCAGTRDPTEPGAAGAGGVGVGGPDAGDAGAAGAGVGRTGAGGARAARAGAVDPGAGASPLPAPSPYTEQSGGLTERGEPASRPVSPVFGTHAIALGPSSVPLRLPLPAPPESSLLEVPDPAYDSARAASPTLSRLLTTAVTDPFFESATASALVAELLDFAATCRLDYATALVAESMCASPPSVGSESALGTDVLEDRQEEFECVAAAVPRFASMLLAREGDPDAPDIPTPRSYAEAIMGTYVDEFPPSRANIVDGMWIFRVKRPPGSPPAFKARYVSRGFSQRQGDDYFQTFFPTPKMTTLRVLIHVAAQRYFELHYLDFSTAFLQGSLHVEMWLRRPPGFTGTFPARTKWSLRRPVYGLRQAPREWHDTLRTTLAALGFAPSTADPSQFLRTDTSLPPFYVLVYVDDLVFATADTEAVTLVKSELQKRHTCTDLGEIRSYLGLQITRDRAQRTIRLTQSYMVHQVLQRFSFQFSSPHPTPLSTSLSLSAPLSDESVEPSGPYPELVGCLMYLMTCTPPDLAYPLSRLPRYVAPGRHRKVHWEAAKRVLRYLCSTSGLGLVLGGRGPVVLTGHADASWVDDSATQRSSQGYTFSLGSGSVSWQSTLSSSVLSSSCEAEIYAGAMAASELRWLTYLLTDLGEQPRSPPVLYVDNKAMIALYQEHRLEHRTKHIALQFFLARELQQRGQLPLAYVASQANTADVFTTALPPGDRQRFATVLGLVPSLPHLLTA